MDTYRRTIMASTLALGLLSLGSGTIAQTDAGAGEQATLEGTEWQLSRMAARGPWDMTIGFGPDGALAVATPCFELDGRYETEGDGIEIEAAESERRDSDDAACDIVQEAGGDLLLQALADAQQWSIDETGTLTVLPGSGIADYELTLEPVSTQGTADVAAPDSITGSWVLVDVIAQTGEPAPLPEGLVITLEANAEGVIGGSAGCSAYAATYAIDGSGAMTIADLSVDEIAECDPTFATWQSEVVRLLESVDESVIEDGRLVLGTDPWGFDLHFEAAD